MSSLDESIKLLALARNIYSIHQLPSELAERQAPPPSSSTMRHTQNHTCFMDILQQLDQHTHAMNVSSSWSRGIMCAHTRPRLRHPSAGLHRLSQDDDAIQQKRSATSTPIFSAVAKHARQLISIEKLWRTLVLLIPKLLVPNSRAHTGEPATHLDHSLIVTQLQIQARIVD